MSFKLEDLFSGNKEENIPKDHLENGKKLVTKLNSFADLYGKKLTISSGYRSRADQLRIYKKKGITDESKIPFGSKHMLFLAVDVVADNIQDLHNWVKKNPDLMEQLDLYFEDTKATKSWLHVQIVKFGSYKKGGTRFFIP